MWELFLPIVLLLLSFIIKFAINRRCSIPHLIAAILELPVDIMFLSSSMVISYNIIVRNKIIHNEVINSNSDMIIKLNDKQNYSLFLFILFLLFTALIAIIWRYAERKYECIDPKDINNLKDYNIYLGVGVSFVLNLVISITCLLYIINLLNGVITNGI